MLRYGYEIWLRNTETKSKLNVVEIDYYPLNATISKRDRSSNKIIRERN